MDFINWFVTSSSDPLKFSLAIRGMAVMGAGWVLKFSLLACGFGVYCLGIDQQWLNQVVDAISSIGYGLAILIGALMTLYGLLRKWANRRWSAAL